MQPFDEEETSKKQPQDKEIIAFLHKVYYRPAKISAEEQTQSLAHVRHRLQNITGQKALNPLGVPQANREKVEIIFMKVSMIYKEKGWQHRVSSIAAVILVTLLVGSMAAVFTFIKQTRTTSLGSSQGEETASVASVKSVYITLNEWLYKIDAHSGKNLWQQKMDGPIATGTTTPVVANGVVYTSHQNNFYAFDAVDGARLWKTTLSDVTNDAPPVIVNDTVYVSLFNNRIYALNTANGAIRWKYDEPARLTRITDMQVNNGTIYATAYVPSDKYESVALHSYLIALNASNGTVTWRKQLDKSAYVSGDIQDTGGDLSVVGNVIYINARMNNLTDQKHPILGSSVLALSTSDGSLIWHSQLVHVDGGLSEKPVVSGNTIYVADQADIYAVNKNDNGALLWQYHAAQYIPDNTFLVNGSKISFLEITAHENQITTLDAKNGLVLTHTILKNYNTVSGGGYAARRVIMDDHMTFIVTFQGTYIATFNNQDGAQLWHLTLSQNIPNGDIAGLSIIGTSS